MKIFQKYAAEFLGTFILVGIGTGAILSVGGLSDSGSIVAIALAFGLALMTALYMLGPVSGGHFNPVVSLAAFLDRRIGLVDMVGYWVMQTAGALSASALYAWVLNRDAVGATYTTANISELSAFVAEALFTLVFVFAVLVLAKHEGTAKYIGMGLALTAVHLVALVFTGASMNPARSFAPALVGGTWEGFWVYLAGPALGAIVAWALYKIIIEGDLRLGDDMIAVKDAAVADTMDAVEEVKEAF